MYLEGLRAARHGLAVDVPQPSPGQWAAALGWRRLVVLRANICVAPDALRSETRTHSIIRPGAPDTHLAVNAGGGDLQVTELGS